MPSQAGFLYRACVETSQGIPRTGKGKVQTTNRKECSKENRRAARHRGFESLTLRKIMVQNLTFPKNKLFINKRIVFMNKIDVSTEEKKKTVLELFLSFNKKGDIHDYFKIPDNKLGIAYIKQIANIVGFDLNTYKERKKRYCIN